jgi:hypothetical protein
VLTEEYYRNYLKFIYTREKIKINKCEESQDKEKNENLDNEKCLMLTQGPMKAILK